MLRNARAPLGAPHDSPVAPPPALRPPRPVSQGPRPRAPWRRPLPPLAQPAPHLLEPPRRRREEERGRGSYPGLELRVRAAAPFAVLLKSSAFGWHARSNKGDMQN